MQKRTLTFVLLVGGLVILCLVGLVAALFVAGRLLDEDTPVGSLSRVAEQNYYWSYACVSADKTMLAAAGDEVARVDLSSGRVERLATAYFDGVACLPDGRILAISRVEDRVYAVHEARWLGEEGWIGDLLGIQPDGRLVTYSRSWTKNDSSGRPHRWTDPLTVYLSDPQNPKPLQRIDLPPERFPGLGEGSISHFVTDPVRVLDDGRVLVLAGFECNYGFGDVRGRPWGLFTVSLPEGYPEPWQPARDCDEQVNTFFDHVVAATSDGSLVAIALKDPDERLQKRVYVVGFGRDEGELFRTTIEEAGQVNRVSVSEDGGHIAVVLDHTRLYVLDGQTGQVHAQRLSASPTSHVEFLDDGSLVFVTSERIATRWNPGTDEVLWSSDAQ